MYDFYKHPPQTLDDVKEYLTSWLAIVQDDNAEPIDFQGDEWFQTHGFRRGFMKHQVFSESKNHRFTFHVTEEGGWDGTKEPNMGVYDSWIDMIDGVAMKYAIAWKLV